MMSVCVLLNILSFHHRPKWSIGCSLPHYRWNERSLLTWGHHLKCMGYSTQNFEGVLRLSTFLSEHTPNMIDGIQIDASNESRNLSNPSWFKLSYLTHLEGSSNDLKSWSFKISVYLTQFPQRLFSKLNRWRFAGEREEMAINADLIPDIDRGASVWCRFDYSLRF